MKQLFLSVVMFCPLFLSAQDDSTKTDTRKPVFTATLIIFLSTIQVFAQQNGVDSDLEVVQKVADFILSENKLGFKDDQGNYYASYKDIPKDKEVFIYCAVGARSLEAAQLLTQQGYTKVYHLKGGIQAWYQNGLPIE